MLAEHNNFIINTFIINIFKIKAKYAGICAVGSYIDTAL